MYDPVGGVLKFLAMALFLSWSAHAKAPEACAVPTQAAKTLNVATLNAWGLPFPVARKRARRMGRIGEWLGGGVLDVVGLQEVWRGARRLLDLEGLLFPRSRRDSGLALMSRLPASPPEITVFSASRGVDSWKGKGVLRSRVEMEDGEALWVLVTHLQSGRSRRNGEVRAAQVEELARVLARTEGTAVVLGDFNFYRRNRADRETEARLEGLGLVDVAGTLGVDDPTWREGTYRFDRVFVRNSGDVCLRPLTAEVIRYGDGVPALSDHKPVRVELAVVR